MRILFLMGSADISGGSLVIFEHALFAANAGHSVTIATQEPFDRARMNWHRATRNVPIVTIHDAERGSYDIVIATWWRTIADLVRFDAPQFVYFVQSIESRFYPDWDKHIRAAVDATYALPIPCITEARWIKNWLETRHGRQVALIRNGIDKTIFNERGPVMAPRSPGHLRILIEGKLGVPFKNVARTIDLVRRSKAREAWLLTPTPLTRYPGIDRIFSRIPIEQTAAVYRSCDLIVKLSFVEGMFGPPLEMFHCGGTAITYDVTGADEYLVDGENALVLPCNDEAAVVTAIDQLVDDPTQLHRLIAKARTTAASWPDWIASSAGFLSELERIADRPVASAVDLRDAIGRMPDPAGGTVSSTLPRRIASALRRRVARALMTSHAANDAMSLARAARYAAMPLKKP